MFIIKISAGLANKMFQYAFYKSVANKGIIAYTDSISFLPKWEFENVGLSNIFPNIKLNEADPLLIKKLAIDTERDIVSKFKRKLKFIKESHYFEPKFSYNPFLYELAGDYYFDGFWQTEKYFKNIDAEIRHDFEFTAFTDPRNIEISKKLNNKSSVSIHIRKGADYQKKSVIGTCDVNYYKQAIDYIKKNVDNPIFFVFSDNHQWVKKNLTDFDYIPIDWNPTSGLANYLDMQLMASCSHNIIANSSYSWWGAWLNPNKNKIVIGPKKWFNLDQLQYDYADVIPDNWVRL